MFDTLQSTNCPISFSHPTLRVNQFPIQITAGTCSRTIITIPTTVCHKMLGIRRSVINISKLRHNLIRHWRRNWNNDRKEFWNIDCCRLRGWDQTTSSVTKSEIFSLKSFIMRLRPSDTRERLCYEMAQYPEKRLRLLLFSFSTNWSKLFVLTGTSFVWRSFFLALQTQALRGTGTGRRRAVSE